MALTKTKIRWTNLSWNVWSGCVQVSPGCARCYAMTLAENKRGTKGFPNGFDLTYRWHKLNDPLKLKQPARIFVNSMTDLFFEQVPDENILKVFDVMNKCHELGKGHLFQILTKRSARMLELAPKINWTPNIWMGVSVENHRWTTRLNDLVQVPAHIRFVSVEPLLGPVDLKPWIDRLHWIITGGETDPKGKWRPMDIQWVRDIRDVCVAAGVAFFHKQGNGYRSEMNPDLDGERWEQYPLEPESPG